MFLNVPIDIVHPEELPEVVDNLLMSRNEQGVVSSGKGKNIVLLSLWDLLRARRNGLFRSYVLEASLVIPISRSIVSGVKFLTGKVPARYMPFNFVVSLLTLIERREGSLFLLGGVNPVLKKTERNLHITFPHVTIVGRYAGHIRKRDEPFVIEAIRKASPSLLLAGKGIRGKELWLARNNTRLNSGFRLWCSDLFDVFAEKRRRPSDAVFDKGLESIGFCFRNPLKFFRIFSYFRYKFLLLFYRLSKRS